MYAFSSLYLRYNIATTSPLSFNRRFVVFVLREGFSLIVTYDSLGEIMTDEICVSEI